VPVPALVEDTSALEMTLVLGTGHDGIASFFPQDEAETRAAIDALGVVAIPALDAVVTTTVAAASSPTTTREPDAGPGSSASATTATSKNAPRTKKSMSALMTTTTIPTEGIGKPPEGESCG
jgi:hypothetical protein